MRSSIITNNSNSPQSRPGNSTFTLSQPCPKCQSIHGKLGAGKKPGEESHRCADCGKFLGYQPIKPLKRRKKANFAGLLASALTDDELAIAAECLPVEEVDA